VRSSSNEKFDEFGETYVAGDIPREALEDIGVPANHIDLTAVRDRAVPQGSLFYRRGHQVGVPSDVDTRIADLWIDVERGRAAPRISEQVCLQSNDFALIMLWYESVEDPEYDEDGERTAKERLKHRQSRLT